MKGSKIELPHGLENQNQTASAEHTKISGTLKSPVICTVTKYQNQYQVKDTYILALNSIWRAQSGRVTGSEMELGMSGIVISGNFCGNVYSQDTAENITSSFTPFTSFDVAGCALNINQDKKIDIKLTLSSAEPRREVII